MNNLIVEINDEVNRKVRYKADDARDIWQTPQYTAEYKTGDCEDYAILKFFLLLNNGISENNLRLCHCTLKQLNQTIPHMVALAFDDGRWMVLDNTIFQVYSIDRYKAINEKFRFNRNGLWVGEQLTKHLPLKVMKKWRDVVSSAESFYDQRIA